MVIVGFILLLWILVNTIRSKNNKEQINDNKD